MRTLLFFIIIFLLIRWVTHAYFNRPSVRGPRSGRDGADAKRGQSRADKRFGNVEDAEYEVLEDDEHQKEKQ